jgi:hypothetical protein
MRSGALFVAYCAEWFRRESTSTFLKWDVIDPALFPQVPYHSKQKLTELGLKYWGRELRRSQHGREFLLTLALEGGIPVRVFVDGARSWLQDYLRAVLRRALGESVVGAEQLLDIAIEERWRVSKSYDHDDFVAVCAELAGAVLSLRRQAEERGLAGVNNSAILDAIHADWRNELPIYVSSEDEALARELLTGLLDEKFTSHTMRGIEARRYQCCVMASGFQRCNCWQTVKSLLLGWQDFRCKAAFASPPPANWSTTCPPKSRFSNRQLKMAEPGACVR